ncbi:MAG: hypothetical protein ACI9XU_002259, partial [Arenicella sp.]
REIIDEIAELMSQPHSQIVREVESLVATLLSKHAIQKDAITQKFESSLES